MNLKIEKPTECRFYVKTIISVKLIDMKSNWYEVIISVTETRTSNCQDMWEQANQHAYDNFYLGLTPAWCD